MNRAIAWVVSAALAGALTSGQVAFQATGTDRISISIDGQPFSVFYIGTSYPKPFLAPLRSASGLIVTRQYPMQQIEGESRDHPHHRGLWIGYGNVNGFNFWENELDLPNRNPDTPKQQGRIGLLEVDSLKPGKNSGAIAATFGWRAPDGTELMEERRVMTFYAGAGTRMVDVDATFTAKAAVRFGDTKEGFFAIRVADSMAEKNGGTIANSEGAQSEKSVWGRRADWVDYEGAVEDQKVGIAVFDHPQNYSHPPRWHVRAYGLFAVNPFGKKEFDAQAPGPGGRDLGTGQSMRFRYRVIVHGGDTPKTQLADWYSEFSK
jgi:hypothetical protein